MKNLIKGIFFFLIFNNYLSAQNFQTDFENSFDIASKENKQIAMIFSGSDWCKSCIHFKKNIIASDSLISYSDKKLILLELDFPYSKKNQLTKSQIVHNEALAEKFNPEGRFPKIIIFDSQKNILGQIIYKNNLTTDQFITAIEELNISSKK